MTYQRRLLPRIYADVVAHKLLRGMADPWTDVNTQLASGSEAIELSDGMPNRRVVFDTDTESTSIVLKISLNYPTYAGYLSLLNHNLNTAGGRVTLKASNTDNYALAPNLVLTDTLGDSTSGMPDEDGSNIWSFTAGSYQYWYITIAVNAGTFADDIEIGQASLCRAWTATHGPDMGIDRSFENDGVELTQSRGGVTHATARWLYGGSSQSSPFGQPFRAGAGAYMDHIGRRRYKGTLSYLQDTDCLTSDLDTGIATTGTLTLHDLWSITGGPTLPFIFTPDSTSTTVGDYMFARFAQDGLLLREVAHRTLLAEFEIEEQW